MKRLMIAGLIIAGSNVNAAQCGYTEEQREMLAKAHAYGWHYNLEHTIPAIIEQESFLGNRILRMNPDDPSFGITHIHFPTLKHLSGLNHWDAIAEAERLVTNDDLAFEYAVKKLQSVSAKTTWGKIRAYNGSSEYANTVMGIMQKQKRCGITTDFVASN